MLGIITIHSNSRSRSLPLPFSLPHSHPSSVPIVLLSSCLYVLIFVSLHFHTKKRNDSESNPFDSIDFFAGNHLSLMAEECNSLSTSPGTLTSSATSPQPLHTLLQRNNSYIFNDCNGSGKMFSDAISIRSLASIGMGSTDGRKMIIRRVPNTPQELLSIVSPPM